LNSPQAPVINVNERNGLTGINFAVKMPYCFIQLIGRVREAEECPNKNRFAFFVVGELAAPAAGAQQTITLRMQSPL
jgi:hypothetical protein